MKSSLLWNKLISSKTFMFLIVIQQSRMFFNRVKTGLKQGFELGRQAIQKAPMFISKALEYGNKASATAKQIADKASQVKSVYETSKKFVDISADVDSKVNRGFDVVSQGVKRIDRANEALQGIGGAVQTLF